ncbi:MAG: T9SS type A sorting domain-containing protein [Paramuribaculum sp.]|nr:T9SS type A sorting domain-containing protein [Paramuribaculum sp.]
MKKVFLAMMALAAVALPTKAATYQSVMFKMSDPSERLCIHIEDDMTLKIADSKIKMESSYGSIELPVNEVSSWTFSAEGGSSDEWAGIKEVTESTVDMTMSADKVVLTNLPAGARVALYNVSGVQVVSTVATDGTAEISLSNYQSGIYVLTFANKSLKIAVGL